MSGEYNLKIIKGYKLTTLQIFYYMPDYTSVINEFVWQFLDINPDFPRAHKFLLHWKENIHASIKEINIAQENNIYPNPVNFVDYLI